MMEKLQLLFFPSALTLVFEILVVLALVNLAAKKWLGAGKLPILADFLEGIFPAVSLIWSLTLLLIFATSWQFLPVLGIWATVTLIMLWPVGRKLNIQYVAYRKPLFILGVLSMVSLPLLGFALQYLPTGAISRLWWLILVVAILTVFSIVAGVKQAIGRPMPMFFRPDILFGDGRVLATGIISLGLSMRFLFGPKMDAEILPTPAGGWAGLYFAIAFGILQIIPLRGMFKLISRMVRLGQGKLSGWPVQIVKETWLLAGATGIMYGFHNAFMDKVPIVDQTLAGLTLQFWATSGKPGLILMLVSGLFFIFVRGGYKMIVCGDPFIRETPSQSRIKMLLFFIGFLPFVYGFAHVMAPGAPFPRPPHTDLRLSVGLALLIWGILMLGPIRIWIQQVQRHALVSQMAAVLLPAVPGAMRRQILDKVIHALADMNEQERIDHMRSMQEAIMAAPKDTQKLMTQARMEVISEIPADKRRKILAAMDKVMSERG